MIQVDRAFLRDNLFNQSSHDWLKNKMYEYMNIDHFYSEDSAYGGYFSWVPLHRS